MPRQLEAPAGSTEADSPTIHRTVRRWTAVRRSSSSLFRSSHWTRCTPALCRECCAIVCRAANPTRWCLALLPVFTAPSLRIGGQVAMGRWRLQFYLAKGNLRRSNRFSLNPISCGYETSLLPDCPCLLLIEPRANSASGPWTNYTLLGSSRRD